MVAFAYSFDIKNPRKVVPVPEDLCVCTKGNRKAEQKKQEILGLDWDSHAIKREKGELSVDTPP